MDNDLDLVNLALEQEVLGGEARINEQKTEQEGTQLKDYLVTLCYVIMATIFHYLNYFWNELAQLNKKTGSSRKKVQSCQVAKRRLC